MRLARPLILSSLVTLAACGSGNHEFASEIPVAPQQRPVPPAGAAPGLTLPALSTDGNRFTPNRDLTANEAVWHLRMALNVAALVCRATDDAPRLQYNRFLSTHKAVLAKANATVDSEYKARFGGQAVSVRDKRNTTVYNFFAQPPAQTGFCAAATAVGATAGSLPSAQLAAFAPGAVNALERPFLDFYAAYADYQRRLAAWNAGVPVAQPATQVARLELDLSDAALSDDTLSQSPSYTRLAQGR